jgi:hypothetical protein
MPVALDGSHEDPTVTTLTKMTAQQGAHRLED